MFTCPGKFEKVPLRGRHMCTLPLEPLKRKIGRVAKPKPVQKPHTDAKVLVMQHVLGDHSENLADCELCTFEGKYKCSYKVIASFCERLRIPAPIDKYFEEPQVEVQKEQQKTKIDIRKT